MSALARLPKVDQVLQAAPLRDLGWRREVVRRRVQHELATLREKLLAGATLDVPDAEGLASRVRAVLDDWARPRPRRVVNATGVLLHTNLGRAPLDAKVCEAMVAAAGYCDLEVGLDDGKRGSRFVWLRPFLATLLGCEDVHVVNNNAAALLLACTVLGTPGGVALSCGQMVEIGDSFRVATMAAAGGCRVVPVGSTNRTHRSDYAGALAGELPEQVGTPVSALLWVHRSNFSQSGFVREVSLPELRTLARDAGVPLIADLGSGSLGGGLPEGEPTIMGYLEQGADLVLCSGDKLLGGPQAGIIAGHRELVQRCRRHPMARALRPDKTALAALHATCVAHAHEGITDLPLHRMATTPPEGIRARAVALAARLGWGSTALTATAATIGGGSLPDDTIPSFALVVPTDRPTRTARRLRLGEPPVVGRIEDDRLLVDLRTVDPTEDDDLAQALEQALA
jgi:L-seryl-tRNA(Ser) seleniumtransferase